MNERTGKRYGGYAEEWGAIEGRAGEGKGREGVEMT